jgi:glycosyltransferase involved in cell wall biosynthesis
MAGCDVVHVYRRADAQTRRALRELAESGVGVCYDNDDDLTAVPKESPDYSRFGGVRGQQLFAESVRLAKAAGIVTTTNEVVADMYRRAGAADVVVIGNSLCHGAHRPRVAHDGIVVGWIAGIDHRADTSRIPITAALRRLLAKYPDVQVATVGLKLSLAGRYTHTAIVPFDDLPRHIGGYDIGISPLADLRGNRARSDIKVKEYAASGVAWTASPVGPYVAHGESEGGQLVADDRWYEALDALIGDPQRRFELGARGLAWARTQSIDGAADRWEQAFEFASRAGAARQ